MQPQRLLPFAINQQRIVFNGLRNLRLPEQTDGGFEPVCPTTFQLHIVSRPIYTFQQHERVSYIVR